MVVCKAGISRNVDVAKLSPTLYEIFHRIGKVDKYLGLVKKSKLMTMLSHEDSIVSYDEESDSGCVKPANVTFEQDSLRNSKLEKLRKEHKIDQLSNHSKILSYELLRKYLPHDYKRLRILVWWRLYIEPLLDDTHALLSEFKDELFSSFKSCLDDFNLYDSKFHYDIVNIFSIEYCLRMDQDIQRLFKILDYDNVFNEKRFKLLITDLYRYKHYREIDFETFTQIFCKYVSNDLSNFYTNNVSEVKSERSKLIAEIVQRNTLGISIERPNEFTSKHCLLDPFWVIEPIPR